MIKGFSQERHALPVHLKPLASSLRIADLVLSIVAFDEVLHDRPRLEEIDGFPIGESVSERWNAPIGIDGCEPWFLLCVLGDIDLLNLIGQTAFRSAYTQGTSFSWTVAIQAGPCRYLHDPFQRIKVCRWKLVFYQWLSTFRREKHEDCGKAWS